MSNHDLRTSRSRTVEDRSLDRLVRYLRRDHVVEVLRRPDRERSSGRAVDAELSMDSRLIAVEVTELNPIARADSEIARLERALQEPLEARVGERNLGCVVVDLDSRLLPSERELRASIPQLLEDITGCLAGLEPAPKSRKDVTVDTRVRFVRQMNLIQLPEMADHVTSSAASPSL